MNTVSSSTIVLPRSCPDLDGVACALAYAELLNDQHRNAAAWIPGEPDAEARYVYARCEHPSLATFADVRACRSFVLVDASSLQGFPDEIDRNDVTQVIDHRAHHDAARDFPRAELAIEPVGAAATLIAERFRIANVPISRDAAMLLYGAVMSNTQCLRGSVTTDRDRDASEWLLGTGYVPADLLEGQFAARRVDIVEDLGSALQREHKTYADPEGSYVVAQLEFWGAAAILEQHRDELTRHLLTLGPRVMLNMVDLESGSSRLYVPDNAFRAYIAPKLTLPFDGDTAFAEQAVLRKQIVAEIAGVGW